MAESNSFTAVLNAVGSGFAQLFVGQPRLLYQAGFADRNLAPVLDPLHLGPMRLTTTNAIPVSDDMMDMIPPSSALPHGAARFTIRRPSSGPSGTIGIGPVVHPFPSNLEVFRISATFSRPLGPHGPTDSWAVVVHAREGCVPDTATRDTRITVTLQSAFDIEDNVPGARMNTVGGAPVGTTPPFGTGKGNGEFIPNDVFNQLFLSSGTIAAAPADHTADELELPQPSRESVFTLDLLVDRVASVGHATLYVRAAEGEDGYIADPGPGYLIGYSENRPFIHPYIPFAPANVIGAAGINIALAASNGPASVTLRDFRIYGLTRWDRTHGLFTTGLEAEVASAYRSVRRLLVDWAFNTPSVKRG
jgi:hypothetical protein